MAGDLQIERPLIACDIGNSRMKFGCFDLSMRGRPSNLHGLLPFRSCRTIEATGGMDRFALLEDWLAEAGLDQPFFCVASVQRRGSHQLETWAEQWSGQDSARDVQVRFLTYHDFDMELQVEHPDRLGIDRLAAAWGARRLAGEGVPVIVVDHGTAITVDLVSTEGVFCGGAILPGSGLMARSLFEGTDALPEIDMQDFTLSKPSDEMTHSSPPQLPPPLGRDTESAIRAGVTWGVVGALQSLIGELVQLAGSTPRIVIAGGASTILSRWLVEQRVGDVVPVEDLVLLSVATRAAESLAGD